MKQRKIFFISLTAIVVLILALAAFTYSVNSIKFTSDKIYSNQDAREYNSVLIRNFDYDSLILGSSMSQGFKCSEFDAAFGGESMKLACSAMNFAEIAFFTDQAVRLKPVKRIMFDAPAAFFTHPQTLDDLPMEYYQDDFRSVLFSKSFSINALLEATDTFRNLCRGKVKSVSRDALNDWNRRVKCSEKEFAKKLFYDANPDFKIDEQYRAEARKTVTDIVIPMVKRHPDTEFLVFFPPFSAMYFRLLNRSDFIALKREIAEMLMPLPNLKLYDFETAFHVTENFDNYRDLTHYSGAINSWIITEMQNDRGRLTPENLEQHLNTMLKRLEEYDYNREYQRLESLVKSK
ncbi:MAG: hypothetical protein J6S21_05725 [Victivallales bacterium]|nr:hypothetical protein [Victivallales bacterium]